MVKKTRVVVLCDWCGLAKEGVEKRTIFLPAAGKTGRQVSFDACSDCRGKVTLTEWETLLPEKPKATRKNRVVSVEEVEKLAATKRRSRRKVG